MAFTGSVCSFKAASQTVLKVFTLNRTTGAFVGFCDLCGGCKSCCEKSKASWLQKRTRNKQLRITNVTECHEKCNYSQEPDRRWSICLIEKLHKCRIYNLLMEWMPYIEQILSFQIYYMLDWPSRFILTKLRLRQNTHSCIFIVNNQETC